MNEIPFEKYYPKTPAEIFRAIDNQSVNRKTGESLIERYGGHRVREALVSLQEKMGIELSEEVGNRINRVSELVDEFYAKMIVIYPPSRKKGGK
jgi:chemotaxis methyl-accepting protein methylase